MSGVDPYSEDALREQWDFLDAMVERQATTLRAGGGDADDDEVLLEATSNLTELTALREEIAQLKLAAPQSEPNASELLTAAERKNHDFMAELKTERQRFAEATLRIEAAEARIAELNAELLRMERNHHDMLSALRLAHEQVESLQPPPEPAVAEPEVARPRRHFWRR